MNILIGIDYSINSPGFCCIDTSKEFKLYNIKFFTPVIEEAGNFVYYKLKETSSHIEKYTQNAFALHDAVFHEFPQARAKAAMEGYSFGSKGKIFNLAENAGILKRVLWESRIPFKIYQPQTIKRFATNNGRSDKEQMLKAFEIENDVAALYYFNISNKKYFKVVYDFVDSYYVLKMLWCEEQIRNGGKVENMEFFLTENKNGISLLNEEFIF